MSSFINLVLATIFIACQGIVISTTDKPIPFEIVSAFTLLYTFYIKSQSNTMAILNLTSMMCMMMASSYADIKANRPDNMYDDRSDDTKYEPKIRFKDYSLIIWQSGDSFEIVDQSVISRFKEAYSNDPDVNSIICLKYNNEYKKSYIDSYLFTSKRNIITKYTEEDVYFKDFDESHNNTNLLYFLDAYYGEPIPESIKYTYTPIEETRNDSVHETKQKSIFTRPWINTPFLGYGLTISVVLAVFLKLHMLKFKQNIFNFPSLTLIIVLITLAFQIISKLSIELDDYDLFISILCIVLLNVFNGMSEYVEINNYNQKFITIIAVIMITVFMNRNTVSTINDPNINTFIKSIIGIIGGYGWTTQLGSGSSALLLKRLITFVSLMINVGVITSKNAAIGIVGIIGIPMWYLFKN